MSARTLLVTTVNSLPKGGIMSRHPFSRYWKGPVVFVVIAAAIFAVCLWFGSYLAAFGTLLISAIGYGVYMTGESSDLPGTAGKDNKNVPT
jgi:hypothetical protein